MASEKQPQTQRAATIQPPLQPSLDDRTPSNLELLISNSRFGPRTRIPARDFGVITGHSFSNSQPRRLEPIATHRKQRVAASSNRQLLALFDSAYLQPVLCSLPVSNRSRYRLEINISPTKQRTEALSNRSKSGVFGRRDAGSPPDGWRACRMPVLQEAGGLQNRVLQEPGGLRNRALRRARTGRVWHPLLREKRRLRDNGSTKTNG